MIYKLWYQQYLQLYKRKIAEKTRESYARIETLIEPVIGEKELEAISPDDIQAALVRVEETAGSRQAQIAYALLHAAFSRAVRSRHLERSPVEAIDKPHHVSKEGRVLEGKDWELLAPVVSANVAYALMCFAGLRRGEVLALQKADIDFKNEFIHVCKQRIRTKGKIITKTPKSEAGTRKVPIDPILTAILKTATRYLTPNALIVPIAPETLNHNWTESQKAVGIKNPYRLHDLRHTYATRLTLDGLSPRVLQYVIGHSSYTLTAKTYTHINATSAKIEISRIYQGKAK